VLVTEIEQPLAVRRLVALAEAVYSGRIQVEDLSARLVADAESIFGAWKQHIIPVIVDPAAAIRTQINPMAVVDARMLKEPPELGREAAPLVIGMGPGFSAGDNCHAVVETNRGYLLGRVIWAGKAQDDTGAPEPVRGYDVDRVLRAPARGEFEGTARLGSLVDEGEQVAIIGKSPLIAPFAGALRGLLHDGLVVEKGMKVGDLDPRGEPEYCRLISDKALAVGGGVLEAVLSRPLIRSHLGE
jgi:xanthine dehydrogenase accessory factor